MDTFVLLSDDKVYEICESLNNESLSNLVQTSSRVYNLCQEILDKRKTKIDNRCNEIYDYFKSVTTDGYFNITENDRTDLRNDIEKYWVNQSYSNIGTSVSINWKTRKIRVPQYFGREDIFVIKIDFSNKYNHYNIFVEPNLSYSINAYQINDPSLFNNLKPYLNEYIKVCLPFKYFHFVKRQQKWFREKPWLKIEGKTPEEAAQILKDLGW